MQKQLNRGQDGVGVANIKIDMEPGYRYISRYRTIDSEIWFPSIVATLVATRGFVIGQSIREKISTDLFRNLLLWMCFIMGMRMIVEAIL